MFLICSYFKSLKLFSGAFAEHFAKTAHKVAKSKYLSISKMNLTFRKIPFPMIYSFVGVSFVLQK